MPARDPVATRTSILLAADRVVLADGVTSLTLEAVAREAGVSKGGLLYHFPSKQALVEGMVESLSDTFSTRLTKVLSEDDDPENTGRWLRAYARATIAADPEPLAVGAGLFAAVANSPDLLDPLRANFHRWQELAEGDGLDPALATVIRLAVEGLWFADLLGLAPPTPPLRAQVLERIIDLLRDSAGAPGGSEKRSLEERKDPA